MRACLIQNLPILFLLGFCPCSDTLVCHKGIVVKLGDNLAVTPTVWPSFETQNTDSKEICQETLVLIDIGERSLLVGSKGSSQAGAQDSKAVTIYSRGPGMVAASYAQFCSQDLCNKANSSQVLLKSLSRPVPRACSRNSNFVFCPKGTQCYIGDIDIEGGGISASFSIDGCLALPSKYLLGTTDIGIFSVLEKPVPMDSFSNIITPGACLTWVLGLGISLAICMEGLPSLLTAIPCDS